MADAYFKYKAGIGNAASYLVSGRPFITGSVGPLRPGFEQKVEFPLVTKRISVIRHGAGAGVTDVMRVHFNSTSSTIDVISSSHYIELDSDQDTFEFNVKCKEIYISAPQANAQNLNWRLYAELTQIDKGEMYDLTGVGLTSKT